MLALDQSPRPGAGALASLLTVLPGRRRRGPAGRSRVRRGRGPWTREPTRPGLRTGIIYRGWSWPSAWS